jgi:hypothetical protein
MYLKCAHPDCSSDFDYAQGRLFRIKSTPPQTQQPSHWHGVKHFWLCTRCCESFTIEYQKTVGAMLMEKLEHVRGEQPCYYVLQPEPIVRPVLPGRVSRKRSRRQKQKMALAPVVANAIEVLENRNLERRGLNQ